MELLDVFLGDWLTALSAELDAGVDARRGSEVRARQLADVLAGSLAGRGVLCDLFGAQGGVLEHDVSVEVVTRHKRASPRGSRPRPTSCAATCPSSATARSRSA